MILGTGVGRLVASSSRQLSKMAAERAASPALLLVVGLSMAAAGAVLTFTSARGLYPPLVVVAATAVAIHFGNRAGVTLIALAGVPFLVLSYLQREYRGLDLFLTGLAVPLWMLIVATGGTFAEGLRRRDAELAANAQELTRRALHDPLTGLPNRTLLSDRLTHALARAQRQDGHIAVLFLDLDGFKEVNDRHGHAAGDEVLVEVARRLNGELRKMDTAARLGGDEFVLLCEDLAGEPEATLIAQRVSAAVCAPVVLNGAEVAIAASVGLAVSGSPDDTAEGLLRAADAAMYKIKHRPARALGARSGGHPSR